MRSHHVRKLVIVEVASYVNMSQHSSQHSENGPVDPEIVQPTYSLRILSIFLPRMEYWTKLHIYPYRTELAMGGTTPFLLKIQYLVPLHINLVVH